MVERVGKQAEQQGLAIELTQEAKELIAREGFDPQFGARPLRRAVQRMIEDPLAEELLLGTFQTGDLILTEVKDGDIVFRKGERPAPAGLEEVEEPAGVA
jgi:ATP-dependent Clp protease ATP-binding subunit ClpC